MMRSSPIHTRPTSTPANRKELPQTTTSKVNLNLLKIWPDIVPDIWCITKNKSLCFWQCGGCETFGLDPDPAFSLMRIWDQNNNMSKFKQEFSKKLLTIFRSTWDSHALAGHLQVLWEWAEGPQPQHWQVPLDFCTTEYWYPFIGTWPRSVSGSILIFTGIC